MGRLLTIAAMSASVAFVAAAAQPPSHPPPRDPRGPGPFPLAELIRPAPEDEGPLEAGEQEELLAFAEQRVPAVYEALRRMQEDAPQRFSERMQRVAPRLRQLKRIFERNPALGRRIVRYAENQQRMHTARRIVEQGERSPAMRRRLAAELRPLMAENLRIEMAVLNDRIDDLSTRRDEAIEAELRRLTGEGHDWANEPAEVRQLLRRFRAADDDAEREAILAELRRVGAERVDGEIAHLRERLEAMRTNAPVEVDRRMRRILEPPGRDRPPPHRQPDGRPPRGSRPPP